MDLQTRSGHDTNPAFIAKSLPGVDNVEFYVAGFEDFDAGATFDDVLSFANHHTYDGNTRQ